MSILNTARSIYAMNEDKGLLGSVGTAINAHARAAMHPTNMIGRMFGFGSFVHSFAERRLGSPRYLPGGMKNYAKAGVKGLDGAKASATASKGASSASGGGGGGSVVVKQLGRIEENTGHTVGLLTRVLEGDQAAAKRDDIKQDFAEEKTREEHRLFQSIADKLDKLSVAPQGPASGAGDGKTSMWDIGKGIVVGHIIEKIWQWALAGFGAFFLAKKAGNLFAKFFPKTAGFISKIGFRFLGLLGSLASGLFDGITTFMETGDLSKSIESFFSGLTFGVLSPEWIRDNFLMPLTNTLDWIFKGIIGGLDSLGNWAYEWLERNLGVHNPFGSTTTKPPAITDMSTNALNHRPQVNQLAAEATNAKIQDSVKKTGGFWTGLISMMGAGSLSVDPVKPGPKTPEPPSKFVAGGQAGLGGSMASSLGVNGVPAEGMALLDTIAKSEAGPHGYRGIVGTGKFGAPATFEDMSDHPRIRGVGLTRPGGKWLRPDDPRASTFSTAAGRYQFTASRWDKLHRKHPDLPKDFSPQSQDLAAWRSAQDVYKAKGGGDLAADLQDPRKHAFIGKALSSEWTSLPGGLEPNSATGSFNSRLASAGQNPTAALDAAKTLSKSPTIAMASMVPRFDVAGTTTTTQAAARQSAAVRQETDLTATSSSSRSVMSAMEYLRRQQDASQTKATTPAPAMPPTGSLDDAVDDIVAKILVAMGAVSQT